MNHLYRPIIPPLPDGVKRPLWSVMIPTYNCARFLRETLASVLSQALEADQMQIEVVDDCSSEDNPEAVVHELGQGRVMFYRQPEHRGHTGNFETCLLRARGRLIHLLHGDDLVLPEFYTQMSRPFLECPEIGAAFCRVVGIEEDGYWSWLQPAEQRQRGIMADLLLRLAERQRIQTPSMVVRREVYEKLGGFDRRLSWSEDWEMWVRVAAHYPVWHEPQVLALYRMHSKSNTARHIHSGENVRDARRCIEIFSESLPEIQRSRLIQRARAECALQAIKTARTLLREGSRLAAWRQVIEGLRCSRSPRVFAKLFGRTLLSAGWLRSSPHSNER